MCRRRAASIANPPLFEVFDTIEKLYQPGADPRQRGRSPSYEEVAMLKTCVLMVEKRIKTFSGPWHYVEQHRKVARHCGFKCISSASLAHPAG